MECKYKSFWRKAALSCAGYSMVSNSVVTPSITAILETFQGTGQHLTNFILSGSNLIAILFALLAGFLTRYVSKRKLMITALILFCVGGIGGAVAWDAISMSVLRALDGASDGIVTVVACSLIAEVYADDEKSQSQVYGWMHGLSSLLGIIASFVAGLIATINWRFAFLLNSLALISLVLVILFVPETPLERVDKKKSHLTKTGYRREKVSFVANMFFFFTLLAVYYSIVFLIDIIVNELQIGNSVLSGTLTSLMLATMSAANIFFGKIYMKFKSKMPIFMLIFTGGCMVSMAFTHNIVTIACLITVATFAATSSLAYYPVVIAKIAPKQLLSSWMSGYTIIMFGASYFSTYIPIWVSALFGTTSVTDSFKYSGGLLFVLGIIHIVFQKIICLESVPQQP